jgi:predicted aldo/keto reductase-like oxidoreductase
MKPMAGGAFRDAGPALRFSLSRGMDVVIPGMDSVELVRLNAAVGAGPLEPTAGDLATIAAEAARWEGAFCRRCGYCKPCPNGLDIPFLFLIEAYYTRYGLTGWALERLAGLDRRYADCAACGECVERCPYDLDIPAMMAKAAKAVI